MQTSEHLPNLCNNVENMLFVSEGSPTVPHRRLKATKGYTNEAISGVALHLFFGSFGYLFV